jgi:PAS domain S-box-containing protein
MRAFDRSLTRLRQHSLSLRSHLVLLVLAALLPVVGFSTGVVVLLHRQERASVQRGLLETVRTLAVAVDQELRSSITALNALAASERLDKGDLAGFYGEAQRVLRAQHGTWESIVLSDPSGQQLINLRRPFGTPLPKLANTAALQRTLTTRAPVVSGLFIGALTQRKLIAVQVPVLRDDDVRYILAASFYLDTAARVLTTEKYPRSWIGEVFDGNGVIVARTHEPDVWTGQPAAADVVDASRQRLEGWMESVTGEGIPVYVAFHRSALADWTVALKIPKAVIDASLHRNLWLVAGAGTALCLLAVLFTAAVGRRIATPIRALTADARDLGRGRTPPLRPSVVRELQDVTQALHAAGVERQRTEEALRDREERLRAIVNQTAFGTAVTDLEGRYIEVNDAYSRITGYTEAELRATNFISITHPDDLPMNLRLVRQAIDGEIPGFVMDKRYVKADGSPVWVRNAVSIIRDRAGRPANIVVLTADISDRKLAETALERAKQEAESANAAKDQFLAVLSHELRTPLTAMLGWARMLRTGRLDGDQAAHALDVIERNTNLQTQLVNDLLDVSRIVAGTLEVDKQPVNLVSVIESALDSVRPHAEAKAIALESSVDPDGGLVLGDALRLQQIVTNLLSNAVKFTPTEGRVSVALHRQGARVRITVSDTGIGFDADTGRHLFDRFWQAERRRGREHGGLGLGLTISRYLVEMHSGTIRAESPGIGGGATFIVELPLVAGPSWRPESRPAGVDARPAPSGSAPLEGLRALVVDDEADARDIIGLALTQAGATVRFAASTEEALRMVDEARVDVIVSDLGMPGHDGFDLIARLRADERVAGRPPTPAVALTAYASSQDRDRALRAGFNVHLPKPIEPAVLIDVVVKLTTGAVL